MSRHAIDLSTVFSTFDMDKLGKNRRRHWKEGLNISNIAKFKSDMYWSEQRYSSTKLQKFTDICMVEASLCPHHANICKNLWLWGAKPSLVFKKSLSQWAILLLRCSFQWCWQIFPNLSMSKFGKSCLLLRKKENGCICLRSSSTYVTCKGVFTRHLCDFCTGASSLQFPLMALLFTWYHHKMSCRRESPWCVFTCKGVFTRQARISLRYEI